MSVRITRSNSTVFPVDKKLCVLVLRNLSCPLNGFSLGVCYNRGAIVSFAFHRPFAVMGDNMLIWHRITSFRLEILYHN